MVDSLPFQSCIEMSKAKKYYRDGAFWQQHEEWLASPAYRDLNCTARCLLTEFQRVYSPGRNGQLSISVANAAKRLNVHRDTASRAFHDLVTHEFLILRRGELWQQRKAREWELTIYPYENLEPKDDWRHWKPGKPDGQAKRPKKSRSQSKGQTVLNEGAELTQSKGQQPISQDIVKLLVVENQ